MNANDRLINVEDFAYNLIYVVKFDVALRFILNIYQRQEIYS